VKKIVVFVMGQDRPGIIAAVSKTLFDQGCNLEDVSQTILQTDFVGIFIASMKDTGSEDAMLAALRARIEPLGLSVHLRLKTEDVTVPQHPPAESFVITTIGPDRSGLMAGITDVLARYGVNITNLKAVFKGDRSHQDYVMIYEVDIPSSLDQHAFRTALYSRAGELGLDLSLQHRDIFEQLNRV
jgi:glycine cleavage system transcriptional repressor